MGSLASAISFSQAFSYTATTSYTITDSLTFTQALTYKSTSNHYLSNSISFSQAATWELLNHLYINQEIAFSQSLSASQSKGLESQLNFEQTFCYNISHNTTFNQTLAFSEYLTTFINGVDDPRNNPTPVTAPVTISFSGPIPEEVVSFVEFDQLLIVLGGHVYDFKCDPPALVPNSPPEAAGWEALGDWSGLSDSGWSNLAGDPTPEANWGGSRNWIELPSGFEYWDGPLNISGKSTEAWRRLFASYGRGQTDPLKFVQHLSHS